jgi:hypothetical protein
LSRPRFLIDECLSVELAALAWERGYQASHLRDLNLLGRKDAELVPVIFEGDWCFVTKNARDFRGPDNAKGSAGEYAGADLHAGLVCIHGPPEGFTRADQLEAFAIAIDLIEQHGSDPTNLLVEVVWAVDGIGYEVAEFPPRA